VQEQKFPPAKSVSIADIFFKAKELEQQGVDIIHFDVGEPDYEPPYEIVNATISALKSGKARYASSAGIAPLRNAIAEHVNFKYRTTISPNQVLYTAGGRLALFLVFSTLPRDSKVGIISPDWPAYRELSEFMGFPTIFFKTRLEQGWNLDFDEIERSGTNVLVINYPNNPTGKMLDSRSFDSLIKMAMDKKIKIISDEVYSDFVLSNTRFKSVLSTDCDYILATSLSKSYSMTGYRAAYLISDNNTISKLTRMNNLVLTSAPEFVQYGAIAAFGTDAYVREKVELIKRRRDVAIQSLREKLVAEFYPPDGSLYIFPRLKRKGNNSRFDSEQFALDLLEKEGVSVTPGTVFGEEYRSFIRMTLLQSEDRIKEGIERMAHLLA
jgi:aspartate aminotransferase